MSIVKVAKLAGLSHSTVSRVINNQPGVADKTVTRVQEAMRKLGYEPPARRRGPQNRRRGFRTGTIAVLMFGTESNALLAPATAAAIHAVEDCLAQRDLVMTLGQIREGRQVPSSVLRGEVDGLILHGYPPSADIARKLERLPAVWIMSRRGGIADWGDRVAPDNEGIGRIAAEYLVGQGHRRVAFLHAEATHRGFDQRAEAFRVFAEQGGAGVEVLTPGRLGSPQPDKGIAPPESLRDQIDELVERISRQDEPPTGLFVPRGQLTVLVYESLRRRGLEPGRDVEVIACDNDPVLAGLRPTPATVDIRAELIGTRAVEHLIQLIEQPRPYTRTTLRIEPSLVRPVVVRPPSDAERTTASA